MTITRATATAALGGVLLALSACGADEELSERTLRFDDRQGRLVPSVDADNGGPPGQPGVGDQLVGTRLLLDDSGDRAGTVNEKCALTAGGADPTAVCNGTIQLDDGRLAFTVDYKLSEESREAAVTGGTGVYEGASGSVIAGGRGDAVEIHLFLP